MIRYSLIFGAAVMSYFLMFAVSIEMWAWFAGLWLWLHFFFRVCGQEPISSPDHFISPWINQRGDGLGRTKSFDTENERG